MSKHISFPAEHLSAYDLGRRIQVVTAKGAKITDELVGISATLRDGKKRLHLTLKNTSSAGDEFAYGAGAFEVSPEQFVRRVGE